MEIFKMRISLEQISYSAPLQQQYFPSHILLSLFVLFFSVGCDAIVQLIKSTQYTRLAQSPASTTHTSFHFAPLQLLYTQPTHTNINRTQTMPEICVQCVMCIYIGEQGEHPNPNACVRVRAATEQRRVIYMTNIVCAVRWNENL